MTSKVGYNLQTSYLHTCYCIHSGPVYRQRLKPVSNQRCGLNWTNSYNGRVTRSPRSDVPNPPPPAFNRFPTRARAWGFHRSFHRRRILRAIRAGEQQIFEYVSLDGGQHASGAVPTGTQPVRQLLLRVSKHEPSAQPFASRRSVARAEHGRS